MPLRLRNLIKPTENIESLVHWLFQLGLILDLSGVLCKFCDKGRFGLRKDSSFSIDQCCWPCSNKTCSKKVSMRQGSWFSNSNLTLETIVLLTYFWVYRTEQEFVKHELGISHTTSVDWYNFSREVYSLFIGLCVPFNMGDTAPTPPSKCLLGLILLFLSLFWRSTRCLS